MFPIRLSILATMLALVASAARAAPGGDVVATSNGAELHGQVQSENRDGLVLGLSHGASTTIPWTRVASVSYDAPPAFDLADELVSEHRFDEALEKLTALGPPDQLRRPLGQEVLFRRARLQQQLGQVDAAVQSWAALLQTWPEGRYQEEAIRGLVEGQIESGRAADAGKLLDRLRSGSDAVQVRDGFAGTLAFLDGLVLEASGQQADARRELQAAAAREDVAPADRATATLHVGRLLEQAGQTSAALELYRDLTHRDAPPCVLAGAWNELADAARAAGLEHRDGEALTEALLDYLRGVVQYTPLPGDPLTEHERALKGAARCCDLLAQIAPDADSARSWRRRQADLEARLTEPESER